MFQPIPGVLFWRHDFPTFSQERLVKAKQQASSLSLEEARNVNHAIDAVVSRWRLEPIVVQSEEAKIAIADVSHPRKGERATVTVPFSGTAELIHLRPRPHNLNPPPGEVTAQHEISTALEEAHQHSTNDVLQARRDHWLSEINKYTEPLAANVAGFNQELGAAVGQAVGERYNELSRRAQTEQELNG